jgi:hypothetical protein
MIRMLGCDRSVCRFVTFRGAIPILLAVVCLSGCGPAERSANASGEAAKQAVETMLKAWQDGSTPARLRTSEPSITVGDSAFSGGHKLDSYEILPDPMDDGRNYRFTVRLTTTDPTSGETTETETAYEVGMEPVVSISRIE